MASREREEIARRYGFRSFAELLDISQGIPMTPGDRVQAYLARHPQGHWFVWEDAPPSTSLDDVQAGGSES